MKRSLAILPALLLCACGPADRTPPVTAEHYLDQFVDTTVSPAEDFWHYSVGKWLKEHPIPASESGWGIYNVVQEETYTRLSDISKSAAASNAAKGTNAQRIGDLYASAMDTVAIAIAGFAALQPEFDRITAITNRAELTNTIAHFHYIGASSAYAMGPAQDEKNSDRYVVHLYQGGLGMPNRDYYFDTDDRSKMLRAEYVKHVATMFTLLGDDSTKAAAESKTVMDIETALAGASRKLAALRDPIANYNAMSIDGVNKLTPSIKWKEHLAESKISGVDSVVVGQPEFFKALDGELNRRSLDEWKVYLRWHLAHAFASSAGGKFDTENFHYYGTILNGTKERRARWKRVLDIEENYLGDALGQLYVEKYFSPKTKERYKKLTDEIFDAFRARITGLDWMSQETKDRALKKLNAVTKKVGYPDKWRDYSTYAVERQSFLANAVNGNVWESEYQIAKLHKPVDRLEWDMTPQTYNAYYNPSNNEIVLPAAIFILPGIADSLADDALVYAYAGGTTIGHEITHGFDDEGRQFDEKGNLKSWWTGKDEAEFKTRAKGIVNQFNAYIAVDSLHVNGEATQGENIADLGGIQLGWDAFTKTDEFKSGKKIGGLTPAQRYFVGWSLGWMAEIRPENLAVRVKTDVHAPSFLRVIGPVTNLPQFYAAFGVKEGNKMFRTDATRVRIW